MWIFPPVAYLRAVKHVDLTERILCGALLSVGSVIGLAGVVSLSYKLAHPNS
jgi:hypothetical protein